MAPVGNWLRAPIAQIEDLQDAVLGSGVDVMQMSRAPLFGSLAFSVMDGVTYTSGHIGGQVLLSGPCPNPW